MRRKGKTSEKGRGARLLVAAVALLATLLASCDNLITRTPPADVGGGYAAEANSAGNGALTVTASVSGGASRHAMPSPAVSDFAYAALLYPDDSDEKGEFAKGDVVGDKTLSFSFPRPESTEKLTIEIFAFKEGTTAFSEDDAILWKSASGLGPVGADGILNVGTVKLEVKSGCEALGTVSLKVRVPAGCTLEISGEYAGKFKCEKDDDDSNTYTISQADEAGITADAYQLTLTVKKGDSPLYVLSEYINVLNGMCTNKWSDPTDDGARVIDEASFSTTVYVRGTGGWYDKNYADTATADNDNFGSFLAPLETIQRAVDKVLSMNDSTSPYTIYVDGTLTQSEDSTASSMTSFSALDKDLSLTIKALSPDNGATLDAGGVSRVIYAIPTSGTLTLTLENLVITGGSTTGTGGGVYFNRGTLTMRGGAVRDNNAGNYAGGVYVGSNGAFTMEDGVVISGNRASTNGFGGGVYVTGGTLNINDGEISGNTATSSGGGVYVTGGTLNMKGGKISANEAPYYAGVFVKSGTFTMKAGSISDNTANHTGGVYVESGTFDMSGGTISGNKSTSNSNGYGGGVVVGSSATFNMTSGTISNNIAEIASGGGVYVVGTFNMSGDAVINENKAYSSGGGVSVESGGEFTMTGGEIGNNTSSGLCGGGVYVSSTCEFTMSGGAKVADENDVYLVSTTSSSSTTYATITVAGTLTAASPVATITPASYAEGTQVLSAGDGITITEDVCKRFILTDGDYEIAPDGTGKYGVIKQKGASTVYLDSSTGADTNSGATASQAVKTLTKAIELADLYTTPKIIVCATYTLPSGEAGVLDRVGGGKPNLTLVRYDGSSNVSGAFSGNLLEITQGNVTISNVTLDGNKDKVSASGCLLYVSYMSGSPTTVTLGSGATITGNKSTSDGGGAYVCSSGTLILNEGGTISDNIGSDGGGVYVLYGNFKMNGGIISGNASTATGTSSGGGGIYVFTGGDFTMTGGTISGNTTAKSGGGVHVKSGTFTMHNGMITENEGVTYAGGVYVNGADSATTFTMYDGSIANNKANRGAGVRIYGTGKFIMDGGTISGNVASDYGGGVFLNSGTFTMNDGKIIGNTATNSNGGMYHYGGTFNKIGGTISGNTPSNEYDSD